MRLVQFEEVKKSLKRDVTKIERQIETVMDRLFSANSETVMRRYEDKVEALEHEKARYQDKIAQIQAPNPNSREEKLEPALQFITNPWKLWESGNITLRRLVLKLAFADRLEYDRKTGPRAANFAFPFKALTGILGGELRNGAADRT